MVRRRSFSIVFILALFAVYTCCSLMLVSVGASVYRKTTATLADDYDSRTGILYIAERLRQSDSQGSVRVDSLDGATALVLTREYGGQDYETWFYVSDSILREFLLAPGSKVDPSFGQPIMSMQSMDVDISKLGNGLIVVNFTTIDGTENSIQIFMESPQGGI
ncbi:MAG: DUF4860 domain-containing protein [Actinomycetia bacterium]|nr:DUF4860 domain-containing protein [Actinomycetes bacterium]